jgi:hypothetical protein
MAVQILNFWDHNCYYRHIMLTVSGEICAFRDFSIPQIKKWYKKPGFSGLHQYDGAFPGSEGVKR